MDEGWVLHEEAEMGDKKGQQHKQRDKNRIQYGVETTKLNNEDAQSFFSY